MKLLTALLEKASAAELAAVAQAAGTSPRYLRYHLLTGRRQASAKLAAALEEAAMDLHLASGGRTPLLDRREICDTCSNCPYGKPVDLEGEE